MILLACVLANVFLAEYTDDMVTIIRARKEKRDGHNT